MRKIITLAAIVFSLNVFGQTPISGLVAYFPFSGNSVDSSGNGNNAVGFNGVALTSDRFGHTNSAYLFDGSNDYMKITNANNLRNNNFTYSCWVKSTSLPTSGNAKSILELGSGNGGTGAFPFGQGFSINNNSVVGWRVTSTNKDSTAIGYQNGTLPTANTWYHVVVTRNDSIVRTFINTVQVASAVTSGKLPYYFGGAIDVYLGSRKDLSLAQYFTGALDDIAFFNRVLTSTEINNLYNNNLYSGQAPCSTYVANINATGNTNIYQGQSVLLTATSGSSYLWNTGATSQSITVTQSGNYSAIVTNGSGCSDTTNIIAVSVTALTPANCIVASYPFSGNANNGSAVNNNGVVHGAILAIDRYGNANSAYKFNGINDYISVTGATGINNNNYTYSWWAKADVLPTSGGVGTMMEIGSQNYPGGTAGHIFSINNNYVSTTGIRVSSGNANGSVIGFQNGVLPTVNTWYFYTVTRDNAAVKFYINGQFVMSNPTGANTPYYNPSSNDIVIGSRGDLNLSQYFNGIIDDIKIYGCALPDSVITQMYDPCINFGVSISASGNTTFPQGQSVQLTASLSSSYLWSNGATTQSIVVNQTGNYSVIGNNGNGCTDTSNVIGVTVTSPPLSNCLVASYSFSGNAIDSISSNNGVVHGAMLVADRNGNANSAYKFDGVDDYIIATNVTGINNNNYTYSWWAKADAIPSSGSAGAMMEIGSQNYPGGTAGHIFSINNNYVSTTGIRVTSGNSNGSVVGFQDGVLPSANIWYNYTVTRNDSLVKFYINGQFVMSNPTGANTPYYNPSSNDIVIGSRGDLNLSQYFNGIIDDINIYSCALPDSVVSQMYINPCNSFTSSISSQGPTVVCLGNTVQISAVSGNSYLWSNLDTTASITVSQSGNYSVVETNAIGCSDTSNIVTVVVNSLPIAIVAQNDTAICAGSTIQISAEGGVDYQWNTNDSTSSIMVNASGNYFAIVTDSLGCSDTSNVITVSVNSLPVANITTQGNTTFCEGGSVQLSSDSSSNYAWSNGTNLQSIIAVQSGNYFVVVTDVNGCSDTSNIVSVIVNSLPIANITMQGGSVVCVGELVQLTSDSSSNYAWSNGNNSQTITVSQSGNYNVVVTNGLGCSDTSNTITITVNPLPLANITAQGNLTFCEGGSVQLNSDSSSNYAWSNGGNLQSITATQNGNYFVVATDGNGCSDTSNVITIIVNNNPLVNLGNDIVSCSGTTNTLDAGIGNSFTWSTAETSQIIMVNTNGIYSVIVTDANGCSGTDTISVSYNSFPTISGNVSSDSGSINLGIVNLYDVNDTILGVSSPISTVNIINGSYSFDSIPEGQFKILFIPDSATYYPFVLSQYYNNQTIWDSATIVSVVCGQNFIADVFLNSLAPLNGNSVIGGSVIDMGTGKLNALGDPIAGVDIFLRQNSTIIAGTETNQQGVFRFDHVPVGTFTILVNMPGLGMLDTYTVTLASNDSSVNNDYVVSDTSIVPINEITSVKQVQTVGNISGINIFPNPNNGIFNIEIGLLKEQNVKVKIYSAQGQLLKYENLGVLNGKSNRTMDISVYGSGFYTVQIITDKGFVIKKVIVN